jgi:hypothetical protein
VIRRPTAAKWLIDKHAQLAGDIRRYERLMAELADALAQARSKLAALQVTLREFDKGIDPAAIPPRNAWAGKYGRRGALKQAVLKVLQEAAPEAVTTTEMGLRLAARFGLHFATSADFRTWVDNTLLPQLKRCARQGAIERLHNPQERGQPGRWRHRPAHDACAELDAQMAQRGRAQDA